MALEEKLDIGQAFPMSIGMQQKTLEQFAYSIFNKLQEKMIAAMQIDGKTYIQEEDALGLSLAFIREGIKLPPQMLLDISTDIIKKSRRVARWIAPLKRSRGDMWYVKIYVDVGKDEKWHAPPE
jgi:hypothetical protein